MKLEKDGYLLEVEPEEGECFNPRENDNLGTMVCFHRRYTLGDSHNFTSPGDLGKFLKRHKVIHLPLYLYDHSGITMDVHPFSCPWDSGQVGYIYVTRGKLRKEKLQDKTDEEIKAYLLGEVKEYDSYLRGEVYWYSLSRVKVCKECGDKSYEEIESCGGFIGDVRESGIRENISLPYGRELFDEMFPPRKEGVA